LKATTLSLVSPLKNAAHASITGRRRSTKVDYQQDRTAPSDGKGKERHRSRLSRTEGRNGVNPTA
jgi:hypothetical protein